MEALFIQAKQAGKSIAGLSDDFRNDVLRAVADELVSSKEELLRANAEDLARMDPASPLYDRLMLTDARIDAIAADMRNVASLPSPLGRVLLDRVLPNGLQLRKVAVPFGVIGVITLDVFSLCFKSGNACVLKGGKDADASNRAAVAVVQRVLAARGVAPAAATLLPATHEATGALLNAVGYVDVVIPRGGRRLIDFVRDNARIPCIETGAGVVNTYFDAAGDLEMGKAIVFNAKTRRVSVCNALDCLIVHSARLQDLPALCAPLAAKNVTIYADERAFAALKDVYPLLCPATPDSFGTEFMDYKLAIRTVDSLQEAMDHIARYGSGHSESIVTDDPAAAAAFQAGVDAACVYAPASTSTPPPASPTAPSSASAPKSASAPRSSAPAAPWASKLSPPTNGSSPAPAKPAPKGGP